MSKAELERDILEEFLDALSSCTLPAHLSSLDRSILQRSTKYAEKRVETEHLHTGDSLWRKFKEIKKKISHDITPFYASIMPTQSLPSGFTSTDTFVEETRLAIFAKKYPGKRCPESWRPTEWDVFVKYGRPSQEPVTAFCIM